MRTDRTTICAACALRLPSGASCPRCGGTDLYDMTRPRARSAALAALRRWARPAGLRRLGDGLERLVLGYLRYGVGTVCALAAVVGLLLEGSLGAALTAAVLALGVQVMVFGTGALLFGLCNLLWTVFGWLVSAVRGASGEKARHGRFRLLPGDPPELPAVRTERVRGRVRVAEPVPSPLGHEPCAAFRLVGEGPFGPVDDAGGTTFEVAGEEGGARVVLGSGAVEVDVPETPRIVRPDRDLERFLAERGLYPDRGPVRLAESVLRDGDLVEVEGQAEEVTAVDGYRDARRVRVFRDKPGAPLVIRKIG